MRIGVIGGGVVGRATARCWQEHCDEVRVWDTDKTRRTVLTATDALKCDLTFACLPEQEVRVFLADWCRNSQANLVLKSTVPIGTTKWLAKQFGLTNLVHSPEFLTARCSIWDAHNPARNIIGVPNEDDLDACKEETPCCKLLFSLYYDRFPGVPIHLMTSDESEAVKLFCNAFAAAKVSLFNEFKSLADALKLDWDRVVEGVLSDGRIGNAWTKVPGPDGKVGFGGRCLPKDLRMLLHCFDEVKLDSPVLEAAVEHSNEELQSC